MVPGYFSEVLSSCWTSLQECLRAVSDPGVLFVKHLLVKHFGMKLHPGGYCLDEQRLKPQKKIGGKSIE